ncbi:hypothetical protein [Pelosinus propionicus]|uniref:Uncharacterized protein n=1 Tax=Pelosinus propionicus DSM 13327 TaxID=1123291 RepID=A0A1I4MS26_9FIRM|nr:hypothetical protein [Pelosinus propionicus]SFM06094.1 hypothetical protein SAMN04490355_103711 [Pelosinus propionicus DSM 13327]
MERKSSKRKMLRGKYKKYAAALAGAAIMTGAAGTALPATTFAAENPNIHPIKIEQTATDTSKASASYDTKYNDSSRYSTRSNSGSSYDTRYNGSSNHNVTRADNNATYAPRHNTSASYDTRYNSGSSYDTRYNNGSSYDTRYNGDGHKNTTTRGTYASASYDTRYDGNNGSKYDTRFHNRDGKYDTRYNNRNGWHRHNHSWPSSNDNRALYKDGQIYYSNDGNRYYDSYDYANYQTSPITVAKDLASRYGFDANRDSFTLLSQSSNRATVQVVKQNTNQTFRIDLVRNQDGWNITGVRGTGNVNYASTYR